MNLTITYPRTNEAYDSRNFISDEYYGCSATHDVPAKMLVEDVEGNLIPCNYQYWFWGDDHGVGSGNNYVPSGEQPIDPETLSVIKRESFESGGSSGGEGFHDFIRNLMHNPPTGVQFIRYDGVEEVTPPQEHWHFLGIKIAKMRRTRFVHSFSLCRLQTPLDEKYEACIAEKKRQTAERVSNLERLDQELFQFSLCDYFKISGKEISSFNVVPIEHCEKRMISSDISLTSLDKIVKSARSNFVKKSPHRTERIVAVQEEVDEIPPTFWENGKQRVTYHGLALVPKH